MNEIYSFIFWCIIFFEWDLQLKPYYKWKRNYEPTPSNPRMQKASLEESGKSVFLPNKNKWHFRISLLQQIAIRISLIPIPICRNSFSPLIRTQFGQRNWISISLPTHLYWSEFTTRFYKNAIFFSSQHLAPIHFSLLPHTLLARPWAAATATAMWKTENQEFWLSFLIWMGPFWIQVSISQTPFVFAWWVSPVFSNFFI